MDSASRNFGHCPHDFSLHSGVEESDGQWSVDSKMKGDEEIIL